MMVSESETSVLDVPPTEVVPATAPPPTNPPVEGAVLSTEEEAQKWLKTSRFVEILASDASHKSLFVLLSQKNGEQGILLLNKSAFPEDQQHIERLVAGSYLKELAKNDVFGNYELLVRAELNVVNSSLIYPANEKLIAKYRSEEKFVIMETYEDYKTITLQYIEKYQHSLGWVYNFLNKEAEAERIIFEDPDPHNGFILAPDLKWDGKTVENLYVLAMVHRKGIKSVRDLTANDLPLLENVRDKCLQAITEKYGLRKDQIRAYFHYQPSFYHLHMHFVNLKYEAPASTTLSAILLNDVINNIQLVPDYYQKATLSFTRKKSDNLLRMFQEAGRIDEF